MDKGLRPIPALYACYLLRSTIKHASLYVGSTPDPVRRLRQHNGHSKGGAVRTSRDSLRPWEIACLVTGFPSKIAALQFEWAWQNTHLTRHIAPDDRITRVETKVKVHALTGRVRRRTGRPRLSLTDRLANLHLLLQATSFTRWPLKVTFYVEDVYKMWQRWISKHDKSVPNHIEVCLEGAFKSAEIIKDSDAETEPFVNGVAALNVDYKDLKDYLQKGQDSIKDGHRSCTICKTDLSMDGAGTLICPGSECSMHTHMSCLAKAFLQNEEPTRDLAIVPTKGKCPTCTRELSWLELVRELSLRMRGEAELAKVFKIQKVNSKSTSSIAAGLREDDVLEDAEDEDLWNNLSQSSVDIDDVIQPTPPPPSKSRSGKQITAKRQPLQERVNVATTGKTKVPSKGKMYVSPLTIDDSDWDEAEVIT